jgi:hypothetical protein
MPGQGKYTTYYDHVQESDKKQLLETVFDKGPFAQDLYNQADVIKAANKFLSANGESESGTPFLQKGDPGLFPNGVMLNFSGIPGSDQDADISTVEWKKAGDPANPYVADIRSPGPADGVVLSNNDTDNVMVNVDASSGDPRQTNPNITPEMIKPTYVPASGQGDIFENKGTVNPEFTGPQIHSVASVSVDQPLRLGSSMKSAGST